MLPLIHQSKSGSQTQCQRVRTSQCLEAEVVGQSANGSEPDSEQVQESVRDRPESASFQGNHFIPNLLPTASFCPYPPHTHNAHQLWAARVSTPRVFTHKIPRVPLTLKPASPLHLPPSLVPPSPIPSRCPPPKLRPPEFEKRTGCQRMCKLDK